MEEEEEEEEEELPSGVVHLEGMPDDHWSSKGDDRGRASTSFCRRQSRIIDSRGTLTSKGPYEHCATVIPIFPYIMECAELPLNALIQLFCGK